MLAGSGLAKAWSCFEIGNCPESSTQSWLASRRPPGSPWNLSWRRTWLCLTWWYSAAAPSSAWSAASSALCFPFPAGAPFAASRIFKLCILQYLGRSLCCRWGLPMISVRAEICAAIIIEDFLRTFLYWHESWSFARTSGWFCSFVWNRTHACSRLICPSACTCEPLLAKIGNYLARHRTSPAARPTSTASTASSTSHHTSCQGSSRSWAFSTLFSSRCPGSLAFPSSNRWINHGRRARIRSPAIVARDFWLEILQFCYQVKLLMIIRFQRSLGAEEGCCASFRPIPFIYWLDFILHFTRSNWSPIGWCTSIICFDFALLIVLLIARLLIIASSLCRPHRLLSGLLAIGCFLNVLSSWQYLLWHFHPTHSSIDKGLSWDLQTPCCFNSYRSALCWIWMLPLRTWVRSSWGLWVRPGTSCLQSSSSFHYLLWNIHWPQPPCLDLEFAYHPCNSNTTVITTSSAFWISLIESALVLFFACMRRPSCSPVTSIRLIFLS